MKSIYMIFIILFLLFPVISFADSAGPNNGSSFSSWNLVGTVTWTNPSFATADDGYKATTQLPLLNKTSYYLRALGFNFSINLNATITGIQVDVKRRVNINNCLKDYSVKIVKAGTVQGTEKADTVNKWSTTEYYKTYGGDGDLWGLSWTPADINNANFGFVISAIGFSYSVVPAINHIRITVYYTLPSMQGGYLTYTPLVDGVSPEDGDEFYVAVNCSNSVSQVSNYQISGGSGSVVNIMTMTDTPDQGYLLKLVYAAGWSGNLYLYWLSDSATATCAKWEYFDDSKDYHYIIKPKRMFISLLFGSVAGMAFVTAVTRGWF